jgi:tetratricopeptide (TPR) repeat protein
MKQMEIDMKTLLLIGSLTLISHASFADINQIDAAANTMNIAQLKQISSQTFDYEKAYAEYRLAITANILGQRQLASTHLDSAQANLEQLIKRENSADASALLASIYGMQIAFDNSKAATLGMKSSRLLTQAEQLDATNPRVKLVQAISAFNTPSIFGGGIEKAQTLATAAITLFEAPCENICWGHAEAYTWRGLAKQEDGDMAGAISDWQTALTVDAQYGWAKFLLSQQTAKQVSK